MCLQIKSNRKARQRIVGMAVHGHSESYAPLSLTFRGRQDIRLVAGSAREGEERLLSLVMRYPATGGWLRAGLMQADALAGFAGDDEVGMSRYWHIQWLW
jgi:hypothetical protein